MTEEETQIPSERHERVAIVLEMYRRELIGLEEATNKIVESDLENFLEETKKISDALV